MKSKDNKNDAVYLWSYRGVATQANAAGGAITVDITPGAGNYLELINGRFSNSGTNGLAAAITDSLNNSAGLLANVASAAGVAISLPTIGTAATASLNSMLARIVRVHGTDRFTIYQSAAGAQNDTMTIVIRAYVRSRTAPVISKARSNNAADVTIVESYNTITVA